MKQKVLFTWIILLLITLSWTTAQPPIAVPDGFAGSAGTTGGGNATPIHVRSGSELKSAVSGDQAKVIVVHGNLKTGRFSVGSNTTIIGADESAGISGALIMVEGTNYIFQNLTCGPSGSDVMGVSGGTNVFITNCTFHDAGDEILSLTDQADYVTISWCKFYFDNSHGHAFGHLIGSGDNATGDRGKLHVTMHHNWYDKGVIGRMPRVRFGKVHLYNNYLNAVGNKYCIGTGIECQIRLDGVHFDGVEDAWSDNRGSTTGGKIGWKDIKFTNGTSQPTYMPNSYPVFELPYDFKPDKADDVQKIVTAGAGNKVRNIQTFILPVPSNDIPAVSGKIGDGRVRFFDLSGRLTGSSPSSGYETETALKHFRFSPGVYVVKQPIKGSGTSIQLLIGN